MRALRFTGNDAFSEQELRAAIATTPSSLAGVPVLGTRRCLDPDEFVRDVQRVEALYRRRGFPDVAVDTTIEVVGDAAIRVTFRVREGAPIRVLSLRLEGLEPLTELADATELGVDPAGIAARFPLQRGSLFDRDALERGRDSLVRTLRNAGWPAAEALIAYTTDEPARTADVEVLAVPGTRARIGEVRIVVDSSDGAAGISDATIRRAMGLRRGDWYSARALIAAQRALYQLDAFQRVELQPDQDLAAGDSVIDFTVRLVEGDRFAVRGGVGWATLDCVRMQGQFTDRDFVAWAPRLELNARVSKVGLGEPLDVAPGLCQSQARSDPYSATLNYFAGVTIRQPVTGRRSRVPTISLFSSTLSEYRAFLRRTPIGGALAVTNPLQSRVPSTLSYQLELGRTDAEPAFFCAVFNACDADARTFLERTTRLAAIGYSLTREAVDDPLRPTQGSTLRLDLRHASTAIGSDRSQQFNRVVGDATWYREVASDVVLLAHVRAGVVFGGGETPSARGFVPPQERLYAGGPTTVRGFVQNELGPAVYIVSGFTPVEANGETYYRTDSATVTERVVPTGGNTLVVGNIELQVPSPFLRGLLSWAAFTDIGRLWNRGGDGLADERRTVSLTPGLGVRVVSPFGPIRIDVGYNPYERPAGAAYFNAPLQDGVAPLYCVSPRNTLPVSTPTVGPPTQAPGACPSTYRPARRGGFLARLNPSIWIGQAF